MGGHGANEMGRFQASLLPSKTGRVYFVVVRLGTGAGGLQFCG